MKKHTLIFLTLVPVITGYILNLTLLIPGLGTLLYYLLPCVTFAFWFYLGTKYSKTDWNGIQAVIVGNAVGFVSLGLYCWQLVICSDSNRILFFSALSQYFVANTNFVTAEYALLFETEKNTISQISATAMQILGLLLMILIFTVGYIYGKGKKDSGD